VSMNTGNDEPRRSGKAVLALVLGIASLLASPIMVVVQYIALISVAFISTDQGAGSTDSIISIAVFAGIALIAIGLPVAALVLAARARRDIRTSPGNPAGSAMATVASILAAIALGLVLVGELFNALSLAGVCSLDGCG